MSTSVALCGIRSMLIISPKIFTKYVVTAYIHNPDRTHVHTTEQSTVEPPNKGHFGNRNFVLFSETVSISEACHCLTIASFNHV